MCIYILAKSFIIIDYLILQSDNEDAYVEDRHQIAKEKTQSTHFPITVGGLDMRRVSIKAECLHFDSEIKHLRKFYHEEAPRVIERNITRLLERDDLQVNDLITMGSRNLKDLSKIKTDLAKMYIDTLAKLAEITQEWDDNQYTREASAYGEK